MMKNITLLIGFTLLVICGCNSDGTVDPLLERKLVDSATNVLIDYKNQDWRKLYTRTSRASRESWPFEDYSSEMEASATIKKLIAFKIQNVSEDGPGAFKVQVLLTYEYDLDNMVEPAHKNERETADVNLRFSQDGDRFLLVLQK